MERYRQTCNKYICVSDLYNDNFPVTERRFKKKKELVQYSMDGCGFDELPSTKNNATWAQSIVDYFLLNKIFFLKLLMEILLK